MMNRLTFQNVAADIGVGLLLFIIQVVIFAVASLALTASIFPCGNDFLYTWTSAKYTLLFFESLLILELWLASKIYKSGTIVFAVLCCLLVAMNVFPILVSLDKILKKEDFYESYAKDTWQKARQKPIKMIRTIYDEDFLIGSSRQEVVLQLGANYAREYSYQKNELVFDTDLPETKLILIFEAHKLKEYQLKGCLDFP